MNSANNSVATRRSAASRSLRIATILFALIIGCEWKDYEILQKPCSDGSSAFWGSSVPDFSGGRDYSYAEIYEGSNGDICRRFLMVTDVPGAQIADALDKFKNEQGCKTLADVGSTIRSYSRSGVSKIPIWFDWTKGSDHEAFAYTIPARATSVGGTTGIKLLIVSRVEKKCGYWSSYER